MHKEYEPALLEAFYRLEPRMLDAAVQILRDLGPALPRRKKSHLTLVVSRSAAATVDGKLVSHSAHHG